MKWLWASTASGLVVAASVVTLLVRFGEPRQVGLLLPVITAALICGAIVAHKLAQRHARTAEIVRSFAGLSVLHQGHVIHVDAEPLLGEYTTRREAAHTALERGRWAVIVRAYGRWYLLAGSATSRSRTPVSFRTRAVADVVPSVLGDALSA